MQKFWSILKTLMPEEPQANALDIVQIRVAKKTAKSNPALFLVIFQVFSKTA